MTGSIRFLFKRFGYIEANDMDFFFFESDVVGVKIGDLRIGQEVTFEPSTRKDGIRALHVTPVGTQ